MIDPVAQSNQPNSLVNQADIAGLPSRIANAIKTAAARTGVDFSYLLNEAAQESSFDPNAKATSSSTYGSRREPRTVERMCLQDFGRAECSSCAGGYGSAD